MQNVRLLFVSLLVTFSIAANSQDQAIILNYIQTYRDAAIAEMQRTGVPASIKLAQGIHETMAGTSMLVTKSNNHFGIKCKANWTGESVSHDDDARGECFRKYPSAMDSYRDHSDFLKNSSRYAPLFKLDPTNYSGWAYGLKKAGYATNPKYPQVIIRLIEDYHLQDYTMVALGKMEMPSLGYAKFEKKEKEFVATPAVVTTSTTIAEPEIEEPAVDYPSGEFRINDTKVIYAKAGTSFLAIAQEYNVPLARLFEFNDRDQAEVVEKGELVFLQRKRKNGAVEFHVVEAGETLQKISQVEGVRLESILENNQLQKDMIPEVGERIYLKSKAPSRPRLTTSRMASEPYAMNTPRMDRVNAAHAGGPAATIHIVQPKETLYGISRKYQVSKEEIVEWNQLGNADLKPGQQLKIYK